MAAGQVYLNDAPLRDLPQDRALRVEDVLRAYGMDPERMLVFRLRTPQDPHGEPVAPEEQVPREGPVFYRAVPRSVDARSSEHGGDPGPRLDVPQRRHSAKEDSPTGLDQGRIADT